MYGNYLYFYPATTSFSFTSWYNDISKGHSGRDVMVHGRFDKLVILFEDTLQLTTPVYNVSLDSPSKPDVRVCVHKNLQVKKLKEKKYN